MSTGHSLSSNQGCHTQPRAQPPEPGSCRTLFIFPQVWQPRHKPRPLLVVRPVLCPWVCPCPAQSPGGDHASMQGAAGGQEQEQEQEQEPLPSLPCRPVRCAAGRGRTASLPPDHAVLKVGPRQLVRSWAAAAVTLVVDSCGLRLRTAARQPIDGRWMEVGRCGRLLRCRDLTLPSVGI